jgi:hypothetical protein
MSLIFTVCKGHGAEATKKQGREGFYPGMATASAFFGKDENPSGIDAGSRDQEPSNFTEVSTLRW